MLLITKTTADIDTDNKTVDYNWTSDDKNRFEIYEISGETYTKANEVKGVLNEGEMTLTATFGGDPVPGASYIALFNTGVKSEQTATDTSYDQLSDVLISKPVQSNDIENEELMLQFKRETAFVLMTAKNLEGSSIIGASICADKKIVAEYDVQSQSFLESGSKTIAIANGDNAVSSISNGTADVFFASVPVEGTSLKVRVVTCDENGVFKALYEKFFASGKSIDFARGDVRPFGIQMAKCEDELTIDLTKDETTTATEDEMSWEIPGFVSIVAEKAGASTDANNYYPGNGKGNTHFFTNSTLTFTPRKGVLIGSIVFEAGTSGYANALKNSTWTNASAAVGENNIVTITPILGYQTVSVVLGGTTGGDSFKINYGVAESHNITVADDIANGSVSANVTSAVPGTEITLIPSPAGHYYLDTWIVTIADTETPVAVTDNKFIMPNAPVNVSAIFRHNPYFEKLTTAPADWRGDYLIVYEDGNVAFDGSLTTLDAVSNTKEVTIEENKIEATPAMKAIQFTVDYKSGSSTVYSLKSASGKYISGTTTTTNASNGIKQADTDSDYEISFNGLTIESKSKNGQMIMKYNSASDQNRFRFYTSTSSQQAVALYKLGEAPRDLTNIEITTEPEKKDYKENECFDPAGLVITKYFDCGDPVTNYAYADHPSEFSFEPALDVPLKTTDTKVTVTVGGKTADIDITVTEVASHDVTFMSNGEQFGEKIQVKEGANITFPATNPSIDGVEFMGWTKTPISGTQQTAPEMVNTAEEKMGTVDITYYAVFAKKTEGSVSVLETVGFESSEGYTATTTYNSSSYTTGANGSKWTINYGAFATSGAIIGSQSAQFRVYKSGGGYGQLRNTVAYGEDIMKVSFSAKAANTNGEVTISSSTNSTSWTDITTKSLTATTAEYDVSVSASGVRYIKFTAGGTKPSSGNYSIYVDGVKVYSKSASSYSNYCTTVATLESVVVSGTPTKTTYVAGESFEPAGLTVTGYYSDGSDKAITEGITWSTPAALAVGQTFVTITATVNGVTSEAYEVTGLTVTAPVTITGISATGTPSEFWKGDTFNHNGITIKATWSNETETDVTSFCEFTGYDMGTPGQQTVTVTYQEKTCTYGIEVKTITNTEQTAYTVTEAKGIIDAGKDLGSEVYVKGKVSKVDKFNEQYNSITYWLDNNTFQVYGGLAKEGESFSSINDVEVDADVIVKGKIKKFNSTYEVDMNNRLVYYKVEDKPIPDFIKTSEVDTEINKELDVTDCLNIPIDYTGTISIEVKEGTSSSVNISGLKVTFTAGGDYTLTVTAPAVEGKYAKTYGNIKFSVKSATLQSVSFAGSLTKTIYTIGDTFDKSGITLMANYSDDSSVDVTNQAEWVVDPEVLNTAGDNIKVDVYASFGGKETDVVSYYVKVNKKTSLISIEDISIEVGKEKTVTPSSVTPSDATLTFERISGDNCITISGNKITGTSEGTATVRASFAGNDTYAPASADFTVEVSAASATKTATLTKDEITSNFTNNKMAYATEETYTDGDITWKAKAYADANNRPWMQLKKDSGVYIKISAPSPIKEVRLTITSATNSSGGVTDITKHTAFSGTVRLKSSDSAGDGDTNDICSTSSISNNSATLTVNSPTNSEVYIKVSSGARIWGIEVDY